MRNDTEKFPFVYLDNNATTRPAPEVVEAMLPYFTDRWGNPSSMHLFGGSVMRDVDDARARVAAFIGADPSEIVFTGCATESDNAAIMGAVDVLGPETTLITSKVEHPAILAPLRRLRDKRGMPLVEVGVDSGGNLNMGEYAEALAKPGPKAVFIMWANNETGVVFDIPEIARMAKEAGAFFHTDAVQAAGKIPIDVSKEPIDTLAFAGHKMHAPKGIGVLFVRRGTRMGPYMTGGHQERGRRAGTENVAGIAALAAALKESCDNMPADALRVCKMRDRLIEGLGKIPHSRINGSLEHHVPGTVNLCFEGVEGESLLLYLDREGICASSGSACTSGSLDPSHVLLSLGIPHELAHGSLRLSIGEYNTDADIDHILAVVPRAVEALRAQSPIWAELEKGTKPHLC